MTIKFDMFSDDYTEEDFLKDIVNNVSKLLYDDLKARLNDDTDIIAKIVDKRVIDVMKNDIKNMVQKQVNCKISDIYSYIDRCHRITVEKNN